MLPDNLGTYGRKGKDHVVVGTVTGTDPRGVTVTFDNPFNGLPDCHATRDELQRETEPTLGAMGTLGESELCNRCGGENVIWAAPSPLWNRVMRGNDINGDPRWGDLVCIRCFIVLAEEAGVQGRWRVLVDPEPDDLIYQTRS